MDQTNARESLASLDGHSTGLPPQTLLPASRPQQNVTVSKGKRRPQSRASTASAHSLASSQSHSHVTESDFTFQNQALAAQSAMSGDGMLMQNAPQVTGHPAFPLDPSLPAAGASGLQYPTAANFMHTQAMPGPSQMDYANFVARESQLSAAAGRTAQPSAEADTENADGLPSALSAVPAPAPAPTPTVVEKPLSQSAQNDLELRRLFRENENRSLQDIANQLQANERGPQSEKTRQIFAMLWLNSACKKSSGSVPRGRVYGHYVSRCGTERVTVLNPASFGKLVRVMFPAIQTRRLGMRGESKYHYCGLSLEEDSLAPSANANAETDRKSLPPSFHHPYPDPQRGITPAPQLPAETAVFPSPGVAATASSAESRPRRPGATGSLFWDPNTANLDFNDPSFSCAMIERELRFPRAPEATFRENEPIALPDLDPYLPAGTDADNAAALTALYRSHCTSLIDCVRFCREKAFFHFFTSFHGTLTVPVQKLLANPALAPWIKECDWMMYQKMIRVVAPLTLQVVPKQVVDFLKAICKKLGSHIKSSFQSHPAHVIEAKLGPATIFASLLDRTLRVNLAAHAAANILCNDANRDQMYEEWLMNVETVKIVQNELPNCGYAEVLHILTTEIRGLLEPLNVPWDSARGPEQYGGVARSTDSSTEGVLDRWSNFLTSLPERFPRADARTIMGCVNAVSTAALRDITINGGKSFGSWWITKLWLDEMLAWMAEKGGFMEHAAPELPEKASPQTATRGFDRGNASTTVALASGSNSGHESRFSSVDGDFNAALNPTGYQALEVTNGPATSTFVHPAAGRLAMPSTSHSELVAAVGFNDDVDQDDSGIGMRMPHEELSMGKFGFGPESDPPTGLADGTANDLGSDVVVC